MSKRLTRGQSRQFWHEFYVRLYNRDPSDLQSLQLAMWYHVLWLAETDGAL